MDSLNETYIDTLDLVNDTTTEELFFTLNVVGENKGLYTVAYEAISDSKLIDELNTSIINIQSNIESIEPDHIALKLNAVYTNIMYKLLDSMGIKLSGGTLLDTVSIFDIATEVMHLDYLSDVIASLQSNDQNLVNLSMYINTDLSYAKLEEFIVSDDLFINNIKSNIVEELL